MRVVVVFKDQTDYARTVLDYLRDFEKQTGNKLETLNPDSVEGSRYCEVYDIVEYPTIIASTDEGVLQKSWSGLPLPTIMELSYYV